MCLLTEWKTSPAVAPIGDVEGVADVAVEVAAAERDVVTIGQSERRVAAKRVA